MRNPGLPSNESMGYSIPYMGPSTTEICGYGYGYHHSEGGFNWSSQHFDTGDCDDYSEATFGPIWASSVAFAWSTIGGTA
jgi:hypothetical protein